MIIWIDGVLGVGKSTVAKAIVEKFPKDKVEFIDSDAHFPIVMERLFEEANKNKTIPRISGMLPQTNLDFFLYFRKLLEEKEKNSGKKYIVTMALTTKLCKECILDYLIGKGYDIRHFILTASKEEIQSRIENDNENNRDKKNSLDSLEEGLSFLNANFDNAIWINTENKFVADVACEIIKIMEGK